MGQKIIKTSAVLIALYLAVNYATGFGSGVNAASSGSVNLIKAFQGR